MKKKVIRVIARLNIGGPAIHVILLSAYLNPEKYQTILVSGQEAPDEGNMLSLAEEKKVKPVIIPHLGRELNLLHDVKTTWLLYRLFKRERPDIVHTHTAKAGMVGRIAAFLAGVPVVVHTFHGHVLQGYFGPWKTGFFRLGERILARYCSRIIAVSEQCRQDLLRLKIGSPGHIQTIPLGLELDHFASPIPGARATIRREYQIPNDAFVVGMIARMVPIKRHADLYRAIPQVLRSHPDTYFLVVGDGELRQELDALAGQLGITRRCLCTGFRNDLARVYQAVDLVALTSGNEGLPVVIIEALASGKPVVATRVGGVPELIEEGKNGYIVEPYDVDSIARGLIQAVADPQKTRALGGAAQKETLRNYSIQRLAADMEKLYAELSR